MRDARCAHHDRSDPLGQGLEVTRSARGDSLACQPLAAGRSGALSVNHPAFSPVRSSEANATGNYHGKKIFTGAAIDRARAPSSTAIPDGPPGQLLVERKASQSLPALPVPVSNRNAAAPEAADRGFFVEKVQWSRRLRPGVRRDAPPASITRSAPDAALQLPPSLEHAHFAHARSCLPLRLPVPLAHEPDTALDPRSGADPCGRMALRIQS